jgi:hypothetical protein
VAKYHVQKAVDACELRSFGLETLLETLVWGEGRSNEFEAVCRVLERVKPWTVRWSAVFELREIVANADLDEERISRAYALARPGEPAPESETAEQLFSRCLYTLADLLNSPLRRFLKELLPDFGGAGPEVEKWLERTAVPDARPAIAPGPAAGVPPVLLIKIEPDANTSEYHVAA